MRAVVIGAGVLGCAISRELGELGAEVVVVDRNGEVGHGSTSASCGIVRRFYSQPGMVRLAQEASHLWADWGAWLGPIDGDLAVFERPGVLLLPEALDASVLAIVEDMRSCGVPVRLLDADAVEERFGFLDVGRCSPPVAVDHPEFLVGSGERIAGAVFEEDGGYVVSPGLATHNLRLAGERVGVRYRLNTEVTAVRHEGGAPFEVVVSRGRPLVADVVVNAAGPWSGVLNGLGGVSLPLETRPLRREVHALANPCSGAERVPVVGDLDGGVYLRPESGERQLIIGSTDPACDELEWVDDPDALDVGITQRYRERQVLRAMKRFPRIEMGPPSGLAHLYDVTTLDWYPIVDRTDLPGWYVAVGTSGSSFKTAPMIGVMLAGIIESCESGRDHDAHPFVLDLPRTGTQVDTSFLSRLRHANPTTGTVFG
ncbi:MAG: FAD-dependent oxidoreductase [Planctomycetes bacterium]|nr:FAD-dependent oxidoreductase [Planctomycetota bacterium]MDP6407873.1 FAD-dependent oxidoreductase [Planctomycetota bacterium]